MSNREQQTRRVKAEHAQSSRIAAWYEGEGEDLSLFVAGNRSAEPIYEVVVMVVYIQGAGPRTGEDWASIARTGGTWPYMRVYGALGPGLWWHTVDKGWGILAGRPGCEIGFTDSRGQHWIRRAIGDLVRIETNAVDHYGIDRPVNYQAPTRYELPAPPP
jgi:hypothetical protein